MLALGKNPEIRVYNSDLRRYCFGAPYVCDELAGDTVTAGAFAHPAFLKDHHFQKLKSMQCGTLGSY